MALPIDTAEMEFVVESIEVVQDFNTKEPKTNEKGEIQHRANCRYWLKGSDDKPDGITIQLWLPQTPPIRPYAAVVFQGLVARPWEMGDRHGITFSADKMAYAKS